MGEHLDPDATKMLQKRALETIGHAVARVDRNNLLSSVLQAVRWVAPVDAIGLYVLNQDRNCVERFSLAGGQRAVIQGTGELIPVENSILAQIARQSEPFVCKDLMSHPEAWRIDSQIAIRAGVRSGVAFPLRDSSGALGTVVFDSYASDSFSDLVPFLQQVAVYFAVLLSNVRKMQDLRLLARQEWRGLADLTSSGEPQEMLVQSLTVILQHLDRLLAQIPVDLWLMQSLQQQRLQAEDALVAALGGTPQGIAPGPLPIEMGTKVHDSIEISEIRDPLRVLIVGGQRVNQQGLAGLLGAARDIEVVGMTTSGDDFLQLAAQLRPDVVLLDSEPAGLGALEEISRLRESPGELRVIVLSACALPGHVAEAARLGAHAYQTKSADSDDLIDVIRRVARGERLLEASMADQLIVDLSGRIVEPLTDRERQILDLVAEGLDNRQVAQCLGIALNTVRWHLHNVFGKLDAANRTEAVRIAYDLGLLLA